jgi:hypothetical protein
LYEGSARRKAATYTQTQNKHRQTSMSRVGFETTIPVFERTKTVHASGRAASVIGGTRSKPGGGGGGQAAKSWQQVEDRGDKRDVLRNIYGLLSKYTALRTLQ